MVLAEFEQWLIWLLVLSGAL